MFFQVQCTQHTGTPVPSLPGAWRYRVSAGTGWPAQRQDAVTECDSKLDLQLGVAARTVV